MSLQKIQVTIKKGSGTMNCEILLIPSNVIKSIEHIASRLLVPAVTLLSSLIIQL